MTPLANKRQAAKYARGRQNIDTLHAASKDLDDGAKYGNAPWGAFYHYVAMELAPHATKKQMEEAIANALRSTEHQEASIRVLEARN